MPAQRQLGHVTDQESMVRADCLKHLAEQPRENSFSAKDQRTFMDFPRKRWPRSFSD